MNALADVVSPWSTLWGRAPAVKVDFHFNPDEWIPGRAQIMSGATVGLAALLCGLGLVFLFRRTLRSMQRPLNIGNILMAAYLTLLIIYPQRVVDTSDRLTWWLHRLFLGAFLLVALRLVDWLAIAPVLTRGGKLPMPRFVHQIVLAVLYVFVMLAYLGESFGIDVSNVVAGSAVISIVLGLALQETLGIFSAAWWCRRRHRF